MVVTEQKQDKELDFSLIIPVAPDRGAEILRSIDKLDYPKNKYEVIVERGLNPSRNRNNGASKATGKILYLLDDDAVIDKDALKNAKFIFDAYDVSIAGGPQLTPEDDPYFAKACGEVLGSYFGAFKMSDRYKKGKANYDSDENSLTSANMFVRAEAYKAIGGFNETLFPGEDPEFLARAKVKGHKIAYSPELIVYHRRRPNLMAFMKQFFNYGKVRLKKEAIGGTSPGLMFYVPMLFCIYCLGLLFLPIAFGNILFIPLYIYLGIALIVSIYIAMQKDNLSYVVVLPFLFFITHFIYGMGMFETWAGRLFPKDDDKNNPFNLLKIGEQEEPKKRKKKKEKKKVINIEDKITDKIVIKEDKLDGYTEIF